MRHVVAMLATLALILAVFPATVSGAPPQRDTWIVQLRDDVKPGAAAAGLAKEHGGSVKHIYRHALNGFSFRGSAAAAAALTRNPKVALVEADAEVQLEDTQTNATWGLDRIDQRALPLNGSYLYERTGTGVTAYIIDTGIVPTHQEFGGRASVGTDLVGDGQNGIDCNGHGTHVAGTIGGSTYGVAKDVDLVAVRVFGCTGNTSWTTIIAAIDWVIGHHAAGTPAVANMSISGTGISSVDTATNNLINDGVATAVAAGNGNVLGREANACNYSPARVPAAMTISATDITDKKASWANYGNCVDWFAPGVNITSAWFTSATATNTISGTSMATPHTAGVAALYLETHPHGVARRRTRCPLRRNDEGCRQFVAHHQQPPPPQPLPGRRRWDGSDRPVQCQPDDRGRTLGRPVHRLLDGIAHSWSWNFGDGGTATTQSPSHTYSAAGVYTVSLTATNASGSDPEVKNNYITVTAPPTAPTAQFSASPTSGQAPLAVQFTDSSTGSPTSWAWNFGDGGTSNAQSPSHTYDVPGVYNVSLTATNASGSDPEMKNNYVTVTAPPSGAITLDVRLYKVKGNRTADLTWSGATGTNVVVWRNGVAVMTTPNDGFQTDPIGGKGGGTFIYKVCEAGTTNCSPEVSASF